MVVTGENADAGAGLPVPDSDGLIVRGGQDPGIFRVEECRSNVIKMPEQGEDASLLLVVPHLNKLRVD